MKTRSLVLLALLFTSAGLHAQEQVAVVRQDGLLVFLPEVAGRGTYGTYLVPNELGREQIDRFVYKGNPLQINFLPVSELPRGFARMDEKEKLQEFFRTEARYLTKSFGQPVEFTDVESSRAGGVEYLTGTATITSPDGKKLPLRLRARTAGTGILHAGYQMMNRATLSQAQSMADRLLRSFRLVNRSLTPDELTAIAKQVRD